MSVVRFSLYPITYKSKQPDCPTRPDDSVFEWAMEAINGCFVSATQETHMYMRCERCEDFKRYCNGPAQECVGRTVINYVHRKP
jgi:hypothetical protein